MHSPQDFSWAIGPFIIIFMHLGSLLWFVKAALRTWQSGTSVSTAAGKSSSKALRFPSTNFGSSQKNKIPILSGIAYRESVGNKNGAQVWIVKKIKKTMGFIHLKNCPFHSGRVYSRTQLSQLCSVFGRNRWFWANHQVWKGKTTGYEKGKLLTLGVS